MEGVVGVLCGGDLPVLVCLAVLMIEWVVEPAWLLLYRFIYMVLHCGCSFYWGHVCWPVYQVRFKKIWRMETSGQVNGITTSPVQLSRIVLLIYSIHHSQAKVENGKRGDWRVEVVT